jgi:hypothetical protein
MISKEYLKKYVAALNSGNADQVAGLFAEVSDFHDGGARLQGFPDTVGSGREGIRNTFSGVFKSFHVKAELVKLNDNSMEYDVTLSSKDTGDIYIPCIGAATVNDAGEITDYIVRPR